MISKTLRFYKQDDNWRDYIGGYFLLLDLTDRDLQGEFKKNGQPWTLSKCQENFMPVSNFIDAEEVKDPHNLEMELKINGKTVQKTNTGDMIFNIPFLLQYLSHFMTLNEGDLIITGTPDGVGPIENDDILYGTLHEGENLLQTLNFKCTKLPLPKIE